MISDSACESSDSTMKCCLRNLVLKILPREKTWVKLKGQSHEKVSEIMIWDVTFGLNKQFLKF
jgi:hypothetical protein